jgi:hypothetical protein
MVSIKGNDDSSKGRLQTSFIIPGYERFMCKNETGDDHGGQKDNLNEKIDTKFKNLGGETNKDLFLYHAATNVGTGKKFKCSEGYNFPLTDSNINDTLVGKGIYSEF